MFLMGWVLMAQRDAERLHVFWRVPRDEWVLCVDGTNVSELLRRGRRMVRFPEAYCTIFRPRRIQGTIW